MLVMLSNQHSADSAAYPKAVVRQFAEGLDRASVMLGYILTPNGWTLTRDTTDNVFILNALLHVAACECGLVGCIGGRLGHGVRVLEGVSGIDDSLVMWWTIGRFGQMSWQQIPVRSGSSLQCCLVKIG